MFSCCCISSFQRFSAKSWTLRRLEGWGMSTSSSLLVWHYLGQLGEQALAVIPISALQVRYTLISHYTYLVLYGLEHIEAVSVETYRPLPYRL